MGFYQCGNGGDIDKKLVDKEVIESVATDDKVLVVVDGEIKKTDVENIGVREIEGSVTFTSTKVVTDEWQAMSGLNTSKYYYSVAYGNGKYVCVGNDGSLYYSTDGKTWVSTSISGFSSYLWGVTYGNDRFVCVGYLGASYYSTDGLTWQAMTGLATTNYRAVTYGNDRFVCVGSSGKSYYSTDGLTWNTMSGLDTSTHYFAVTYGNDRFVCGGSSGKSYYSTDGLTWNTMSGVDTSTVLRAVTYGNDKFICVCDSGKSYYSTDGLTWTAMSGLDTSVNYSGVTYGTEFVAVGNKGALAHYVYETETETETLQSTLQVAGTLLLTKLYAGETTVTITDEAITQDSTFDIYTDKYGVNPKNVTVDTGSITLEFKPQETDVNVKVVVK